MPTDDPCCPSYPDCLHVSWSDVIEEETRALGPDDIGGVDYDDFNYYERCRCPFCHCFNETEYGARCSDCRSGAHQG